MLDSVVRNKFIQEKIAFSNAHSPVTCMMPHFSFVVCISPSNSSKRATKLGKQLVLSTSKVWCLRLESSTNETRPFSIRLKYGLLVWFTGVFQVGHEKLFFIGFNVF